MANNSWPRRPPGCTLECTRIEAWRLVYHDPMPLADPPQAHPLGTAWPPIACSPCPRFTNQRLITELTSDALVSRGREGGRLKTG